MFSKHREENSLSWLLLVFSILNWSSLLRKYHMEKSSPDANHQPIDTRQDFPTHRLNVPVFRNMGDVSRILASLNLNPQIWSRMLYFKIIACIQTCLYTVWYVYRYYVSIFVLWNKAIKFIKLWMWLIEFTDMLT